MKYPCHPLSFPRSDAESITGPLGITRQLFYRCLPKLLTTCMLFYSSMKSVFYVNKFGFSVSAESKSGTSVAMNMNVNSLLKHNCIIGKDSQSNSAA